MTMHSKWIRGNQVYYDGQSWLDAIGPNVVKIKEEFQYSPVNLLSGDTSPIIRGGWTLTFVEVGAACTLAPIDGADGGQVLLTSGGNEDDGLNMQVDGEAFSLSTTTAYPAYFGIRFQVSDATQSDFIAGLCITDTTLTAGMSDGIYFRSADGAAAISAVIEKNTAETTVAALTGADATWMKLEILFDGTNADFYVNDTLLTRQVMTNLPDDEYLTPSFEYLAGAAGADTVTIDWIRAFQIQA